MAVYRYQAVSVGMWRGKIKRWNTTFHTTSISAGQAIANAMRDVGYKAPGDVVGACSGGLASLTRYAGTGGPPQAVTVYFDWQTPSTWIPYNSTVWSSIPPDTPLDAAGESALVVVGKLPGLSSTGKPMTTRKYLHAVPSRTGPTYSDPDVSAAVQAAFKAIFTTDLMASPSGTVPTAVEIDPWYGNHQRVRGRRKTVAQTAANAFTLGVLAGGGATTSGQGEPFPGGEY